MPDPQERKKTVKLQLAVDLIDLNEAKQLLESVIDLIDLIEVGTPLVLKEGARAISEIKRAYPERDVLADFKIMDAGDIEAQIGFDAGADIVTVLGAAENATVQRAIDQARTCGKKIMVDLIAVEHVEKRAREIDALGADILCVHTAFDVQSQDRNPLRELQIVHPVLQRSGMAVAGGVKPETVPQIADYRPDIVVVGGFIATHPHPRRAATEIREAMDRA